VATEQARVEDRERDELVAAAGGDDEGVVGSEADLCTVDVVRQRPARTGDRREGARVPAEAADRRIAGGQDVDEAVSLGDATRSRSGVQGLQKLGTVRLDGEDGEVTAAGVRHEDVPPIAGDGHGTL
jgi:hypothetical protein